MQSASSVSRVYEAPPSRLTPLTIGKVRKNLVPRLGRGDKKKGKRCQGRRCYKVTDDVFQVVVSGRGSWLRPGLQSCYIDLYPNPAVCLASWGKPRSERTPRGYGWCISLFFCFSFFFCFSLSLSSFKNSQSALKHIISQQQVPEKKNSVGEFITLWMFSLCPVLLHTFAFISSFFAVSYLDLVDKIFMNLTEITLFLSS